MSNSTTVFYRVPIQLKTGTADLDTLYDSDEALLARAAELRARHESLMASDPRYKELFDWLPDRSDFVSGVPPRVPATVGMINLTRWMRYTAHRSIPMRQQLGAFWNGSKKNKKKPKVKPD